MKRILQLIAVIAIAMSITPTSEAQLPDGEIAPDFTVLDIDSVEHNLQSYLDDGYSVILDFSATWCGPCWSYHTSGILEELYQDFGPDGEDKLMIFLLEGDDDTTVEDLAGTGMDTYGDWTEGVEYVICDNAEWLYDEYACTFFPTMYHICPSGILSNSGQLSYQEFATLINDPLCVLPTASNDPAILSYEGDSSTCNSIDAVVNVGNIGMDNLTDFEVTVNGCANCPVSENWSGDLATYESTLLTIAGIEIESSTDIEISISSANDNPDNDVLIQQISMAPESSTHFHIEIQTDNYPFDVSWEILDEGGVVVAMGPEEGDDGVSELNGLYGDGTETSQEPILINADRWVTGPGCYSFVMYDEFGDGLNGSQWGGPDGNALVTTIDEDGGTMSTVWDYNGSYEYSDVGSPALVSTSVSVANHLIAVSFVLFPNPVNDQANVKFSLAHGSEASLQVMNMLGQTVFIQDLGALPGGEHLTQLDFSSVENGMYLVVLTTNGQTQTKKVTVSK